MDVLQPKYKISARDDAEDVDIMSEPVPRQVKRQNE